MGAGGGFVLVPVLLLLFPDEKPSTLTAISLAVVCANAASGSLAYARQRRTDYRSAVLFGVATLPGAVAGAITVGYIPRRTFDGLFASVLGSLGLFLALRSPRTAIVAPIEGRGVVHRVIRDSSGYAFVYSYRLWQGLVIALVVGFISSLLGIGGGVMHVPMMIAVLHFPVHVATATSQFVLGIMSAEGTLVHISAGRLGLDQEGARAALLALGAIPGAQAGAWIARRVRAAVITRALALSLIIVAARLALKAADISFP